MTFLPEYGADKSISSLSNFPTHHNGFRRIPCMSDLWNKKYKDLKQVDLLFCVLDCFSITDIKVYKTIVYV